MNYLETAIEREQATPQSEPIPGREAEMVPNSAGGFTFAVDEWKRLERFLILGAEGGSYYATERDLTKENLDAVRKAIDLDGDRVVRAVVEVSGAGRAAKNDPALFVLALCAASKVKQTRAAALAALPGVARIGTHLFHFASFVDKLRGWGPSLRKAVADWYEFRADGSQRSQDQIAYQAIKYQQRDGWSHRDLLRLAHPTPHAATQDVFRWFIKGELAESSPPLIRAFEQAKTADEPTLIRLIREYGLTREMIPTEKQKSPAVWEALLEKMPLMAMIRTLGRMGACGLLVPMSQAAKMVCERLADEERIRKARVHPIHVLTALITYANGKGTKGSLTWTTVPQVKDALDSAFYLAFQNVAPTGKRFYLGVDVSGSMASGNVAGVQNLSPRMAAAAMAMATIRTEENWYAAGFCTGGSGFRGASQWGASYVPIMKDLKLSRQQSLETVIAHLSNLQFGGTDCALPMLDALDKKMPVDCFIIYTDNETWHGEIHPVQALQKYRDKTGIAAKLIVCAFVSNGFTIADPNDAGMLDIVGFDSAAPVLIHDFCQDASPREETEETEQVGD